MMRSTPLDLQHRAALEAELLSRRASAAEPSTANHSPKPLTYAQESLWFLHQLCPGRPTYNVPQAFRIAGPLDRSALERALCELVKRHHALRTKIIIQDQQPLQMAQPADEFAVSFSDLAPLQQDLQQNELKRILQEHVCAPFDLTRDLPFRARLVRLAVEDHVLALTAHHIISDMESLGILYEELESLYDAHIDASVRTHLQGSHVRQNVADKVPRFLDFAARQRQTAVSEADLAFWREHLHGDVVPLEFPTDAPRQSFQANGALFHFRISSELATTLTALSQKSGVSLYMTLLGAFQILACRYSGLSDFLVGTPFSQRDFPNAEKMIGYLINLLVLRLRTSGEESFQDLLKHLRSLTLQAYSHQNVPFAQLVDTLRLPRHEVANPPCRVVFQYLPNGIAELKLPELKIEPVPVHTQTTKFDFTLTIAAQDGALLGEIEFDTALFEQSTIARMAEHFEILLRGIVSNPNEQISKLPLQGAEERERVLIEWNRSGTDYPKTATIHQLFERQADATPEHCAIIFDEEKLTYRELNERANQLASHLRKLGAQPGEPIGICLERSIDLIVGLLGILKAGGAYVPFDANYPDERLRYMFDDSGVRLLVTNGNLSSTVFQALLPAVRAVLLDAEHEKIAAEPSANLPDKSDPERLTYIIYTSGSTGNPKGVAVPHRGVVRLVKDANYARFDAHEVFLQFAPVSFDASTLEIWGPLLNGATLAIYPPSFDSLEQFAQVLAQHKVTTLWLTAGLFNYIVDANVQALAGVRQLLVGGDVLSVPHIRKALAALPNTQLINGYGPTENTTFTCCYAIPRDWPEHRSIPIGAPISNTQVYILDRFLQPVPIGVPGELCAGGDGVALGYWNRPQFTAEYFVEDPFSREQGHKLYRTGDIARWRSDGTIEFLGRLDNQVKIRGFRIELSEVERAFAELEPVREVVVTAHSDGHGTKYLLAYIVLNAGTHGTESELRQQIAAKLPPHAVPSRIVLLERLPLNANGKVDRAALPPPDSIAASAQREVVQPGNDMETRLLEIWREVLKLPALDVTDNFFEAGGHSLLATRLVMQVNKVFDARLSLATLFQAPTVRRLAEKMSQRAERSTPAIIPRRAPGSSSSSLQQVNEMSDAQVDEMLKQMASEKRV